MKRMSCLSITLALLAAQASAGVYDEWNYRMKITFAGYSKTESLANFPVLVVLSNNVQNSGFAYADLGDPASAADLRFADDAEAVELNYEIEKWDPNGSSYVWVQVPALANSASGIHAYWGKNGASAPPCTTNGATWSNGFRGVWHLSESSGTTHKDYAGYNNVVTDVSGVTPQPSGKIAGAAGFSGGSCGMSAPDHAELDDMGTALTIEGWGFAASLPAGNGIALLSKRGGSSDRNCYSLFIPQTDSKLNSDVSGADSYRLKSTGTVQLNRWTHLAVVFDPSSGKRRFYIDGQLSGEPNETAASVPNNTSSFYLGMLGGNTTYGWNGRLDEVRVSGAARSANWLWASWLSQASNSVFNAFGPRQASDVSSPAIRALTVSAVSRTAATLQGELTSTGTSTTVVSVYWGTSDGGSDAANWGHTNDLGTSSGTLPQAYATAVTLPAPGVYHYRYSAVNGAATVWSGLQSFMAGQVWLDPVSASAAERGTVAATIEVRRDPAMTAVPVTVAYALGGSAVNGSDYQSLSQTVELPIGASSAPVVVTPVCDAVPEGDETATITLGDGLYEIGTPSDATVTIADSGAITSLWTSAGASWANAAYWNPSLPVTSRDVGIVPNGKTAHAGGDLGSAGNRPTIVCQPGGRINIAAAVASTPLRVDGGMLYWYERLAYHGTITFAASGTLQRDEPGGDGNGLYIGPVAGVAGATITANGPIGWDNYDNTNLFSTIKLGGSARVHVLHDGALGRGAVEIGSGTRLTKNFDWVSSALQLRNNVSGLGAIRTYEDAGCTLRDNTVTPGTATAGGVLTIEGNLKLQDAVLTANLWGASDWGRIQAMTANGKSAVVLQNATLAVVAQGGYDPALGQSFILLLNAGTDAISGTFNGLPEGATVELATGATARISYLGNGDGGSVGNDAMLYDFAPPRPTGTVVLLR